MAELDTAGIAAVLAADAQTQMTFGFSRDDAAKFLGAYYENKIYESDPFQHQQQRSAHQRP